MCLDQSSPSKHDRVWITVFLAHEWHAAGQHQTRTFNFFTSCDQSSAQHSASRNTSNHRTCCRCKSLHGLFPFSINHLSSMKIPAHPQHHFLPFTNPPTSFFFTSRHSNGEQLIRAAGKEKALSTVRIYSMDCQMDLLGQSTHRRFH